MHLYIHFSEKHVSWNIFLFGSGGADGAGKCESLRVLRKCGSWDWNKK